MRLLGLLFSMLIPLGLCPQTEVQYASGSEGSVTVLLLHGKTGKPIGHHRLLIFYGDSAEDVQFHYFGSFDLQTRDDGTALMPANMPHLDFVNPLADFLTQCGPKPNLHSFSLDEVRRSGVVAANTCGSVAQTPHPGQLVIFAREPTLRERLNW